LEASNFNYLLLDQLVHLHFEICSKTAVLVLVLTFKPFIQLLMFTDSFLAGRLGFSRLVYKVLNCCLCCAELFLCLRELTLQRGNFLF